jgi:uncharacterized membrane protein HdeD (DUF308 family)
VSVAARAACPESFGLRLLRWRVEAVELKEDLVTQPQTTLPAEAGHWWALALRGVIAILFGLAALLRPDIALGALILLIGAYFLVDGVFALVGVFRGTRSGTPRWLLLLEGVVSILAGIIAFVYPGITAIALLYLVAAWAIITGIAEIATAIRLRQEIRGEWALILGGILSVLFGVLLAVLPGVGILSLIWLIGVYAIAFGVLLLITAFQVRGHENQGGERPRRVT